MFIKQFRSAWARVPDPLRPGKRALEERLVPTGAHAISHDGQSFEADADGWFDVPDHVGAQLVNFRHPDSSRFYQPHEVSEDVREALPPGTPVPVDANAFQAMQERLAELEAEKAARDTADAEAAKVKAAEEKAAAKAKEKADADAAKEAAKNAGKN